MTFNSEAGLIKHPRNQRNQMRRFEIELFTDGLVTMDYWKGLLHKYQPRDGISGEEKAKKKLPKDLRS